MARLLELQSSISAGVIQLEISSQLQASITVFHLLELLPLWLLSVVLSVRGLWGLRRR
jgi:hypothetical protein